MIHSNKGAMLDLRRLGQNWLRVESPETQAQRRMGQTGSLESFLSLTNFGDSEGLSGWGWGDGCVCEGWE